MPSREALRRFILETSGRVGKREISRAFGLGAEHRLALRELLRTMERAGELEAAGARRFTSARKLPETMLVEMTGTDSSGDAVARPVDWPSANGPPPVIFMHPELRGRAALAPGQQVVARLKAIGGGKYEGRTIRRIESRPGRVLGQFRAVATTEPVSRGRFAEAGRVVPTDRKVKAEWSVPAGETGDAQDGELVLAEPLPQPGRAVGLKPVRIVERLGRLGEARSISLICLHAHDIPAEFPTEALAEADTAEPVGLAGRTDLRDVPLVTIDGADARDFDDAVHAEPDPDRPGGWRLLVAIADVAHYVRPGSALDREARRRGNSVYFPDRVVPMLPEALSAGLCSLQPGTPRGCLFASLRIDADGSLHAARFGRGLMRSAARLTYEQLQAARDGGPNPVDAALLDSLYGAFAALRAARNRRGTLDLDLPERRITIADGIVTSITKRVRLDSHRLIEEFMVLANVAVAHELGRRQTPCLYRVHAPPADERIDALRRFLDSLGIALKPAGELRPADLDRVLKAVAGTAQAPLVNEMVLRAQAQAEYDPENIGHFGLSLTQYAHFTSPIRRYADLCVHRALIAALGLGSDGQHMDAASELEDVGVHITRTERRAALAERDAADRYIAAHLSDKIGSTFEGRISGVTRFGLFVTLEESGATGLVPVSSLPAPPDTAKSAGEFWMHDESAQTLTGRRSLVVHRLADRLTVRLVEAAPLTGGLLFAVAETASGARESLLP